MKVKAKIITSLSVMIVVVSCILALTMAFSASMIRRRGEAMLTDLNNYIEANVKQRVLELAENIGHYVVTMETEIDHTMLNAAKLLREADGLSGGTLTLSDLERLREETGMSDLYLGNSNGVFTLSTEPGAAGVSLFDIWEGYRMLVTGESDYLPSSMKIKVETGEIFKFTAIPRLDGRGILESALNANAIELQLQEFVNAENGIKSLNLFDSTLLALTENAVSGQTAVFTKGTTLGPESPEVAELFQDPSNVQLTLNGNEARLYYPVMNSGENGGIRYVLFLDLDTTDYFTTYRLIEAPVQSLVGESVRLNILSLAAVFTALLLFTVFTVFLVNRLLRPLGFFNALLFSFAAGDFSPEPPGELLHKRDEMGEMSQSFRNTSDKMKNLVMVIRNQGFSLKNVGEELAAHMGQTAAAINQIAANIRNMRGQTEKQAAGVMEMGDSVEKIIAEIRELDQHITIQSDHVAKSSEAIEEMLKNIHAAVETLTQNTESVMALAGSAETGRSDLQKVSADIKEIARESEGLLEINSVMENIASQTNLLSMNAAIEAAHAGEAGKGFAVVAGEIRKLAESSSAQSKTTAEMLKKIKASIDSITRSAGVVLERFETIEQEIKTVSAQEQNIHSIMEKQEAGSRQVLETINGLNSITGQVKRGSALMAERSQKVLRENAHLSGITGEITNGMNEMAAGAEHINAAVTAVNELTGENKSSINTLSGEIAKFKVG